ncbi:fimbrial protein [Pseudomonas sp. UBA4194]|uniref:fimbrial protein n=1 Tax=Pseudomonas sp. UBA4194 TaxID=1947317 RepID=UPI0025FC49AC|nr:fimbrial protein [Pseudomonas sp. UBA4194]
MSRQTMTRIAPVLGMLAAGQALADPCPPMHQAFLHTVLGSSYITTDAPIGSHIAETSDFRLPSYQCTGAVVDHVILPQPRVLGINPAFAGSDTATKGQYIYPTNIRGIGVAVQSNWGSICRNGLPLPKDQRFFPFTGEICAPPTTPYSLMMTVFLIKTAPIAPGSHFVNLPLYRITMDGVEWATGSANIRTIVTGCSMPDYVTRPIQVPLGDHYTNDFSGPGSFTASRDFTINLTSCAGGGGTQPDWNYFRGDYANITFEGVKGSTIIDGEQGLLSLQADATAKGVGVQILRDDGSPVPLGREVQVGRFYSNLTPLRFKARYMQLEGERVTAGSADAAANFTVTYR